MRKLTSAVWLPVLLSMVLLVSFLPVHAQDEGPTPDTSSTLTTEPVVTDSPEPPTDEPSPTVPTETTTAEYTSTVESTPTFTETPTATATRTPAATTRVHSSCDTSDVYQFQIVVSYTSAGLPKPTAHYSMIKYYTDDHGAQIAVLQLAELDFCDTLTELKKRPDVLFAEPNYEISLLDTTPNDADFIDQYYLNNIKAPQGWGYETGSSSVIVAVLDSGVDLTHSELVAKLVPGYDFIDKDAIPQDLHGHGTHVAGIIAAMTNNSVGMAGISWGARIMPLRILDASGNGNYANTAQAIRYAVDHGAQVINMSIGGTKYSADLEKAVNYATANGVIMVAATGNSYSSTVLYPAIFPAVIAVGATDASNVHADFSNTGTGIDVVAPGVSIFSLYPGNSYRYLTGTSMAAPMVAGYASLLIGMPGITTSSQVENIIKSTAKDLGPTGWDNVYGYGLIQIGPGIMYALGILPTLTPTPTATSRHSYPTATATATKTDGYYYYPTKVPTFSPLNSNGSATATPGEISALEVTPTLEDSTTQAVISATTEANLPTSEPVSPPQAGNKSWLWMVVGLVYVLCGFGLFLFVRKRYFH
jgi:thermitase